MYYFQNVIFNVCTENNLEQTFYEPSTVQWFSTSTENCKKGPFWVNYYSIYFGKLCSYTPKLNRS